MCTRRWANQNQALQKELIAAEKKSETLKQKAKQLQSALKAKAA